MEKMYLGDIDKENLDWIDHIIDGKMGNVVKKVTEIILDKKTDLNVKSIIRELAASETAKKL